MILEELRAAVAVRQEKTGLAGDTAVIQLPVSAAEKLFAEEIGVGRVEIVMPADDSASAIVRALAAADPNFRGHDPQHECSLCGVLGATNPAGHAGRCPWAKARAWVETHDGPEVK